MADTAAALQRVFGAVKINYAVLGNLCPHVHCHLIPLYAAPTTRRLRSTCSTPSLMLADHEAAELRSICGASWAWKIAPAAAGLETYHEPQRRSRSRRRGQ